MSFVLGCFAVGAATLVVSGAFKVRDAGPTVTLLRGLGIPAAAPVARVVGPGEILVGLAALAVGGTVLAGLVAVLYGAFALMTLALVRRGGQTSCGCFGRLSAPPSMLHVVVNGILAGVAVAAAALDAPSLLAAATGPDGSGALLVAVVGLATWLTVAVLTVLPDTLDAARRVPAAPAVREFSLTPADVGDGSRP